MEGVIVLCVQIGNSETAVVVWLIENTVGKKKKQTLRLRRARKHAALCHVADTGSSSRRGGKGRRGGKEHVARRCLHERRACRCDVLARGAPTSRAAASCGPTRR